MEVSVIDTKQNLVNYLVSEAKRRNELVGSENLEKAKMVELGTDQKVSFDNKSRANIEPNWQQMSVLQGMSFEPTAQNPAPQNPWVNMQKRQQAFQSFPSSMHRNISIPSRFGAPREV
ncbi:5988_t:CDS:2, partial [Dentiscutata erythropus]